MSLRNAIKQSCDIYFYEVARILGVDRLSITAKKYGLGEKVLRGYFLEEKSGVIPSTKWKLKNIGRGWVLGETLLTGIGQGYIQCTPLELCLMAAQMANGGFKIRPRIIDDGTVVYEDIKSNIDNQLQKFKLGLKEKKVKKHEFKSKDGKKKIKYAVKVFMQPDHVKTRAGRFKKAVLTQSKRFKIDPAIAFAIMHTESSFNPKARSPIPAFGLMQLVPNSGARDAYNYIYKQDRLLSDTYLYVPANNIELGCAYIAKIRHDYFKNIKDEKSAYFCTISAYNTGIGNVAMALTGKAKLGPTAVKVNTMKSDKLYKTLKTKLPYAETRNYLKKVTERIDYYRTWI